MSLLPLLTLLQNVGATTWLLLRPLVGWSLIGIGLVCIPVPIVNGTLMIIAGVAVVGHRNRLIRWSRVNLKLFLYRWSRFPNAFVSAAGAWALRIAQEISRRHRRFRWWMAARRRAGGIALAAPQQPGGVSSID